jgi:hypothetical protein
MPFGKIKWVYLMQLKPIKLRFNRVPTSIAAVIFSAGAVLFFDAAAFGHIDLDMNPTWIWAACAGCGFTALMCLKNAVFPSLIFEADRNGIKIGRGLIINRIHDINWDRLTKIEEGTIKSMRKKPGSGHLYTEEVPAVKLVFDESVDLGNFGYKMAHPSKRSNFLISRQILSQSLSDTISTLKEMKARY